MEFFKEIDAQDLTEASIKSKVTIGNLSYLCASVDRIIEDRIHTGVIYCVWGEFVIHREEIIDGVRFTLPVCPNALAWTVTYDQQRRKIVVHCTIDKQLHNADFIESIQQFVDDMGKGLEKLKSSAAT